MDRQAIISDLTNIIGEYLKNRGLELVDLIYRYEGRDLFLRILVDKPEGGISLEECAHINNELSIILDEKDILRQRYILEVSSPGIDRPLKTKTDFLRCIDRRLRVFLSESIGGKTELEGLINRVDDEAVYVDINGEFIKIPFCKVTKAKQILDID